MDFTALRRSMVEHQIRGRGITAPAVVKAMEAVPREALVPPDLAGSAYDDCPLPIGAGQTISQPYVVALMAAALDLGPGERVLEIGTGSGYAAAVLAEIAGQVYTIERHPELADAARRRLAELGFDNIEVRCGDGTLGWPEHAPYQGITVAAGGPELPRPLLEQLAIGGRLVMPLGGPRMQELVRATRTGPDDFECETFGRVQFVPLIGHAGWSESAAPPSPHPPRLPGPGDPAEPLRPGPVERVRARLARRSARGRAGRGTSGPGPPRGMRR